MQPLISALLPLAHKLGNDKILKPLEVVLLSRLPDIFIESLDIFLFV
jgi:hypothetical protein